MQRKTLTERLTNKYQLIVRNEENFADRWTLSFNFARLLVMLALLVLVFYLLVTGVNVMMSYLLGSDNGLDRDRQLIALAARVDSLAYEVEMKDNYINSFKAALDGGVGKMPDTITQKKVQKQTFEISKEEEVFRKKFEKEMINRSYKPKEGFTTLYFDSPVPGQVTELTQKGATVALLIEADKRKPVRSLEEGLVVSDSRNTDSTYRLVILHKSGLATVYDRLQKPLVKAGITVGKSSEIAQAGEQKIIFSMFFNGKTLNPRQYISWE